jgi:hypothetical protein
MNGIFGLNNWIVLSWIGKVGLRIIGSGSGLAKGIWMLLMGRLCL